MRRPEENKAAIPVRRQLNVLADREATLNNVSGEVQFTVLPTRVGANRKADISFAARCQGPTRPIQSTVPYDGGSLAYSLPRTPHRRTRPLRPITF